MIPEAKILAPYEVFDELDRVDDGLKEWCMKHDNMFRDTSALTGQVQQIIEDHPSLIRPDANHEVADPYIIALAKSYSHDVSGLIPIIVTHENVNRESGIPFVARAHGVQTCKLVEVFQKEGWQF